MTHTVNDNLRGMDDVGQYVYEAVIYDVNKSFIKL